MNEDLKEREREFHDALYSQTSWEEGPRKSTLKYYTAVRNNRQHFRDLVAQYGNGKSILEIGCGDGGYMFDYPRIAAQVSGIDISDVAVASARKKASEQGFANMDFQVMDVEAMSYPTGSLDVIYGAGILHHLNIDKSGKEIARVLKPSGVAIFTEPLGHNPLINLYRKLTPNMRSPDEHPFVMNDFRILDRYFGKTDASFYNLFSMAAVPFRSFSFFPQVLNILERVDESVFRIIPYLRRHAWTTIFMLSDPRRA